MIKRQNTLSGVIKVIRDGRGLINDPANKSDSVFISKSHLNGALDQDEVQYSLQRLRHAPYKKAKVLRILKRKNDIFVGRVYNDKKQIFLNISPYQSKKIKLLKSTKSLPDYTVVKVKIVNWNERGAVAKGEIIEVISEPNTFLADHLYIKHKYLTHRSNYQDNHSLKNFDLEKFISKQKHREDFSKLNTFSIDPNDAQDFDDAISIKLEDNTYELIVHIADVSEFIDPDSDLDKAALQNSNSYYFPEKSYHMLPNELATKYCSLVPGEKRLAVSLCFKLTKSCEVISQRICLSIIKNKNRLTYDEVNDILKNNNKSTLHNDVSLLYNIHKVLKKKRLQGGALNLLNTESIFRFGSNGVPSKIIEKKQSDSHSMVEECMLLANKFAAKLLASKSYPIYRNHDLPSRRSFIKMDSLISAFSTKPKNFNDFISSFKSPKKQKVFSKLILKKLKRAEYSQINKGHYGLSFKQYIHFTSPIRRYADLYCHRLLKEVLKKKENFINLNSIEKTIKLINQNEEKAKNAENEYSRLKKLKYIEYNAEKVFFCTIEGFSKKYIIVNINDADLTAVISKSYLKPDRYRIARNRHAIVGQFSKKTYKVGDEIKTYIEKVDMLNQEVLLRFSRRE